MVYCVRVLPRNIILTTVRKMTVSAVDQKQNKNVLAACVAAGEPQKISDLKEWWRLHDKEKRSWDSPIDVAIAMGSRSDELSYGGSTATFFFELAVSVDFFLRQRLQADIKRRCSFSLKWTIVVRCLFVLLKKEACILEQS